MEQEPGGNQMGFETSMVYTMGMALNRALETNSEVAVLVDGQWLSGAVVVSDGYGVVLDSGSEHSIVKIDRVTAVRVLTRVPTRTGIDDGHHDFSEPMPMPSPQMAGVM